MTDDYKLTRLLYPVDEVKYSFITSLILKKNIDECYFWVYELYYSKIDIFPLILQIYLDFYAVRNPKLEHYIHTKINKWKLDKDITHIASIITNLYLANPEPTVFILRQYILSGGAQTSIYYKRIKTTTSFVFDNNLMSALHYKNYANIACNINTFVQLYGSDAVHSVIIAYFTDYFGGVDMKGITDYWHLRVQIYGYTQATDVHILIAIVIHLMSNETDINNRAVFISPKHAAYDDIIPSQYIYQTLRIHRKYATHKLIGSFCLARENLPLSANNDFKRENWLHWEYYAGRTPMWANRINNLSGVMDNVKRELIFPNDDVLEIFYKNYGYELDEQPIDIQNMSLHTIDVLGWHVWISVLFKDYQMPVELPQDFRFKY